MFFFIKNFHYLNCSPFQKKSIDTWNTRGIGLIEYLKLKLKSLILFSTVTQELNDIFKASYSFYKGSKDPREGRKNRYFKIKVSRPYSLDVVLVHSFFSSSFLIKIKPMQECD